MGKDLNIKGLVLRYLFLFIIALFSLKPIYLILTPITVKSSYFILSLFSDNVSLLGNTLVFNGIYISLISSCIAGAAYYLLLILNLTAPMHPRKRIYSLLFSVSALFALNILRIIIFSYLIYSGFAFFDVAHKIVWYFGSTLLLIIVWFFTVVLFNINSIPIYTDFYSLISIIKKRKTLK